MKNNRKGSGKLLKFIFLFIIMLSIGIPVTVNARTAGFSVEALTLQPGSDKSSINLNWYADLSVTNAKVRFTGYGKTITVNAAITLADLSKKACKATVTGLTAGKSYTYQISNDGGENWSKKYTYQVAGDGAFTFAFVGDPQLTSGYQDTTSLGYDGKVKASSLSILQGWEDTLAKIEEENVDFIVSAGDQVDTIKGNENDYTMFFAPELMQELPFAATIGNHDRNSGFLTHFNLPNEQDVSDTVGTSEAATAVTSLAGNYFYQYNNALFVVLNDSDYPKSIEQAAPYIEAFHDTLEAAVKAYPGYDWLFVQHHKSTESVAQHAADADIEYFVEAGFEKLMDEYRVDFVLAGHDHVYTRTYAMYDGKRVSDHTDSYTNPSGSIYVTCNSSSGLKYYNVFYEEQNNKKINVLFNSANKSYPYLANGLFGAANYYTYECYPMSTMIANQNRIPGYSIVRVEENQVTFSTYATYEDNNPDTSVVLDTFTVKKTQLERRINGFETSGIELNAELAASYHSGIEAAGAVESVAYNKDNNCVYSINTTSDNLVKIDMSSVTDTGYYVDDIQGIHIPIKEMMKAHCPDFAFGEISGVAVSAKADVIALSMKSSNYRSPGKLVLLTYEGGYLTSFDTGVQPGMVTFTEDGLTVLTANEGEPGSEKGAKDPRGSITVIELNTAKLAKSKSTTVDFVSFDSKRQELIDSGVILQKGKKPSTDLEPVYITTLGNIAYISLQEANAIAFFDLKSKIFTGIYSIGLQEFGPSFSVQQDLGSNTAVLSDVYGIKMPGGISAYSYNGETYLLTANEGDSKSDTYGQGNAYIAKESPTGNVKTAEAVMWFNATEYDGADTSKAYVYGGRSFSIYKAGTDGLTLLYDSSNDFERITASFLKQKKEENSFQILDDYLYKKGVEPENVTVGYLGKSMYAFIVLQQIGGVMIYDITSPEEAHYVNYINGRNFEGDMAEDMFSEGMFFDYINDIPTLVTSNDIPGALSTYAMFEPSNTETIIKKLNDFYTSGDIRKWSLYINLKGTLENGDTNSFSRELQARSNKKYISDEARKVLMQYLQWLVK